MHVNAGICSAKGKIAWNKEFMGSIRRIYVSFADGKDICRTFEEERFYASKFGTDITNISKRKAA